MRASKFYVFSFSFSAFFFKISILVAEKELVSSHCHCNILWKVFVLASRDKNPMVIFEDSVIMVTFYLV